MRPNKLFTADKRIFLQTIGKLTEKKIEEVIDKIHEFLKPDYSSL